MTTLALVILLQTVAGSLCDEGDRASVARAQESIARGDSDSARRLLETGAGRCTVRQLAALALAGWAEARALAPAGGAVALQATVRQTLTAIESLTTDASIALEAEYAATCIRAALAAAQDERPEMELHLIHARDLSERLGLRGRRALWPQPFNLVAGELWFEVDRYAEAVTAYQRAVAVEPLPMALVGLARALMRLDRTQEACAAYRRATDLAPALRRLADRELARCR